MSLITTAPFAPAETLPNVSMGGREGPISTRLEMVIKLTTWSTAVAVDAVTVFNDSVLIMWFIQACDHKML